jgi:5-deoxy-glucuronate isomerase
MSAAAATEQDSWFVPSGSALGASSSCVVDLQPGSRALAWAGLQVFDLLPGASETFITGAREMCVLPLAGAVRVEVDGYVFDLRDRVSVFHSIADWCYLPIDTEVVITASEGGARVVVPSAPADRRFAPTKIVAESVPVELRGAGQATRQLNNFMAPEVFDGAQRLMCVEVITPGGNWSSYPPHRHDGIGECTVNNEEIYYFRIGESRSDTEEVRAPMISENGFGLHRTYTVDGDVDVNVAVRDGDVFLIPRGYHGPCVAAPGYPMYYLNVLAGPSGDRTMGFCDDPVHHWVRSSWEGVATDPRLPMTSATGPVRR